MQLNGLGKKVLAVAALTALLSACADDKNMDNMGGADQGSNMESGMSGPGAVGTDRVDSEMLNAPKPGSQESLDATAGELVHFAFDSHQLSYQAKTVLRKQAVWLKENMAVNVTVEGHCDERGTREYNLALGQRRSTAVRNFLIAEGVDAGRITATTYGKERLLDPGQSESAHARNRRATTVVN